MPSTKIRRKPDAALSLAEDHDDPRKESPQPRSGSRRDKFALRSQQKIACAECRRLKVKCDRAIPCTTCVKRGCASLCPNGTLPPGDGSRFVMVATDHLHTKLSKLEARMRSLEDALAIAASAGGRDSHPLLSSPLEEDDLADTPPPTNVQSDPSLEPVSLAKALNTLSIERNTQEFSVSQQASGSTESLVDDAHQYAALSAPVQYSSPDLDPAYLGPEINLCQRTFPFQVPGVVPSNVQALIESYLPPLDRAIFLCDKFFKHLSWMTSIVQRDWIVGFLIPRVYKHVRGSYTMHELALVFIALGVGAQVNLEDDLHSFEAQHYCILGRASLAIPSVLHSASLTSIKAVHLLSIALGMSSKEENMAQSTTLLCLAVQLGFDIGLNIDPLRFQFNETDAYERREYFWNLLSGSLWTGVASGRSLGAIWSQKIDCKVPTEEEERRFRSESYGFGVWGCRICCQYLIPVHDAVLAVKLPEYSTILELDKQIRAEAIPLAKAGESASATMKQYAMSNYLDLLLLYLHQKYFAQAMTDHPTSPKDSPYYESVVLAYRAACVVLETTNTQFVKEPELCSRIWRMWSYAFTAAIVVGTLAMRGLTIDLDPNPKEEFEKACVMFKGAAEQGGRGGRAAKALPLLEFMLRKSHQSATKKRPSQPIKKEQLSTETAFQLQTPAAGPAPTLGQMLSSPTSPFPATPFSPYPPSSMDEFSMPVDPFTPSDFGNLSWQGMFADSNVGGRNDFWMPDIGTNAQLPSLQTQSSGAAFTWDPFTNMSPSMQQAYGQR